MHEDDFIDVVTPEYSYIFNFEKSYSYLDTQNWLLNNLVFCFSCVIIYVIIIVGGMFYMLNKPKYNLKRPLALWYGVMALFSIIGFSRTAPELFFALGHRGLYYSVCIPSNYFQNPVSGFWTWALVLSKIVQLCDTMFIVLQKEQLKFLHLYRHLSVIPYFCFTYLGTTAAMRWFSVMEYFINSCMYSYYVLNAMKFKLPICFITMFNVMQIVQMIISYIITNMAYNQRSAYKLDCYITYETSVIGLTYYITSCYFYLKFCCSTYTSKKQKNKDIKIH
ncbi:elongation of very long chain fatty acids protein 6 [Bombus terrestris]|uniref:Elongation of very long chain fatty acids protein n=1 Tax=Bombus terrestris TaxID=30195 RepID=A0A9B2JYB1_BOMTE|nr:elongation of very long chain fatty acids protein 6 [Bombus terrestris]XP_012173585.1 elongation of very long chain fatty acids protein 6 [Bombus terrestris]XP_012173586.1 elongation of very long chain fatty acids protein 6 [Bombus terrestris]